LLARRQAADDGVRAWAGAYARCSFRLMAVPSPWT
jgi:hypothetical protein